jgi:ribosome-associated translation inhibitor RaiA
MMTRADAGAVRAFGERVQVVVQGDIPYQARRWAVRAVERAVRHERWPLQQARVRIVRPPHLVAVCRADIHADLDGHLFHARAEAKDAHAALDMAADRLQRQAEAAHAGAASRRRRGLPSPDRPAPAPGRTPGRRSS